MSPNSSHTYILCYIDILALIKWTKMFRERLNVKEFVSIKIEETPFENIKKIIQGTLPSFSFHCRIHLILGTKYQGH